MKGRKHQVPRQRRIDCDRGRLHVTNLSNHDNVWRLPQHRPQRRCKGHSNLRIHRNLIDSRQLVLHRILDRDQLSIGLVDRVQARVQRRRLARTCRTRNQENSVRIVDDPLQNGLIVCEKSQLGQAQHQILFVQDTHDNRFTVNRGHGRNPQIQRRPIYRGQGNTAVQRQPLLCNADVRHDLNSADDAGLKSLGRVFHLLHVSVDPISQA